MAKILSITIVHYKNLPLLKLCLNSIYKTVKNLDYEVVLVDSETDSMTEDFILEKYPSVKYIGFKDNLGYAKGVNVGLKNSSGDYLLILNPDIIVSNDSIEKMVNFLKTNDDVGLLGPQLLNFNGSIQQSYFRFYTPLTIISRRTILGKLPGLNGTIKKFIMSDANPAEIQYPDWLMGSALMTSRSALNKVGLMDEKFFMYFEDVDWARCFWQNGYKVVYYPEAKMYHYHKKESRTGAAVFDLLFNKRARWHLKSGLKYFIKYKFK